MLEQENEVLRCGGVLVSGLAPEMIFPLVRELAAAGAPVRVPVAVTCRVLGFSRQAFDGAPLSRVDPHVTVLCYYA